ncbi:hypothetical protein GCM10023196_053990 [Actinoallomurus vinaceus]|uniref:Uncharacterized protein n=1 Tax=Actinoallomurus vinaceus TaxID=1080074 RepID=A0ABP8UIV4_9ACTN
MNQILDEALTEVYAALDGLLTLPTGEALRQLREGIEITDRIGVRLGVDGKQGAA